ncbi:MAG: hypothetical protein H7287_05080 [Thermoleophilia bacterium]|nr:hypothetical protein [Thermoleophilia bacterium]
MNTAASNAYVGFPAAATSPTITTTPRLFAHEPGARLTAPRMSGAQTAGQQATAGSVSLGSIATPPLPSTSTYPPSVDVVGAFAGARPVLPARHVGMSVAPEQPASVASPVRMTSVAPGGTARDADLVEATLAQLRRSPSGAQVVDRLLAVGARVNVVSDGDFVRLGHGAAHAFYDPAAKTIYLRRTELEGARSSNTQSGFAAVALAHEGTHLLDDVSGVADGFIAARTRAIAHAGGSASLAGVETQRQALFELTMVKEARAFLFAGQVARELGVTTPAADPTSVAASGPNDAATYGRVWDALLSSPYNPAGRTAQLANF